MVKGIVALFSFIVIGLSLYAAENPSYYMNLLVNSSGIYTFVRILLASYLLAYALSHTVRTHFSRNIMSFLGALLIVFACITVVSPTFFGYLVDYSAIGDMFILFEAGVLAKILSHELPTYKPRPILRSYIDYSSFMSTFRGLLLSPPHSTTQRSSTSRT